MSHRSRAIAMLALVAVLGAGVFAWTRWSAGRERAGERDRLVGAVAAELAKDPLDRSELQSLLNRLGSLTGDELTDERLVIAKARVEHALQRPQAWDTLSELASRPDAPPAALQLGASILAAAHALSGRTEQAAQGIALAERHYQATSDPASLFLAWQLAARAQRATDAEKFANELRSLHPDAPQTRLLLALQQFAEDQAKARPALEALEQELKPAPPELECALAAYAIQSSDTSDVQRGVERLERVLAAVPTQVDARNLLVAGWVGLRRPELAVPHLRWLVERAPRTDERRGDWERILEQLTR